MKRGREDGHLSKEEYELQSSQFGSSTFSRLADNVSCVVSVLAQFALLFVTACNSWYNGKPPGCNNIKKG
jgi:hypothetical protein